MKILMVNKFLYQKGGSETYIIKLGEILRKNGHEVEYFGLKNEKNTLFNSAESYVTDMNFAKGIKANLFAPFRIIYITTTGTEGALLLATVILKSSALYGVSSILISKRTVSYANCGKLFS